jgi:hypothetical protein
MQLRYQPTSLSRGEGQKVARLRIKVTVVRVELRISNIAIFGHCS